MKCRFNIYLIGDKNLFKDENSYLEALNICFYNGVGAFQLRQKDISINDFIKLGEKVKFILKKYPDVKFFVNDRVDAALALEADGVHLNVNSIPVKTVKEKIKNLKIFYSSHSIEEAVKAEKNGADFVTFSPVYKTKNQEFQQGADMLKRAVHSVKIPVFALGGVNEYNLPEIKKAGVEYIAVQSGILKRKDIGKAVKTLSKMLDNKI
ncbi:MAG: thiamine phosphate synthase [Deltaproteobacteria bacterium]|jgi:thiamine-phosphate pyrophosphorylase|nr:thiamine phosphate synthase [Deltaproteobacteria bacterium]